MAITGFDFIIRSKVVCTHALKKISSTIAGNKQMVMVDIQN
jgi:hypothetical protein